MSASWPQRHLRRPYEGDGGGGAPRPAGMWAELKGTRISVLFCLTALLLADAILFGGASRQNEPQLMMLELLSLPVIGLALLQLQTQRGFGRIAAPLALLLAMIAVSLAQLVPIPFDLWQAAPGRGALVGGLRLTGFNKGWLPLSLTPDETRRATLALLIPLGILLGAGACSRDQVRLLAAIVVLAAGVSLLIGALQLAGGLESPLRFYPRANEDAAVGVFANRSHQGALLLTALPVLATWIVQLTRENRKLGVSALIGIAAFAVVIVGVVITHSRAALMLGVIVVVASLLLLWRNSRRARVNPAMGLAGMAALLAMGAAGVFAINPVLKRFAPIGEEQRLDFWPSVIDGARHFSPLGSGAGSFVDAYRMFEPLELVSRAYLNHAHNEYLQVWFEQGWPGLAVLGLFAVWVLWRAVMVWRNREGAEQSLGQAATVIIVLLAVHSAVDYPLRTPALAAVFALMCAILARSGPRQASARRDVAERSVAAPRSEASR